MIKNKSVTFEDEGSYLFVDSVEDTTKQTKKLVFIVKPVDPNNGEPSKPVALNVEDMRELLNWLSKDVLEAEIPEVHPEAIKPLVAPEIPGKGTDNGMTSSEMRARRAALTGVVDMSPQLKNKVKVTVDPKDAT